MTLRLHLALAAALLLICSGCGSSSSPTGPSGGGGTPVSIVNGGSFPTTTAFAPSPGAVAAGGSVTWTNNDNTAHTSTGDGGAWNSGTIGPRGTFTRTFPSAGTFTYHCTI